MDTWIGDLQVMNETTIYLVSIVAEVIAVIVLWIFASKFARLKRERTESISRRMESERYNQLDEQLIIGKERKN